MKSVLLLGAGMVAGPLADYLLKREGIGLTVADMAVERAQRLVSGYENGRSVLLNVEDNDSLENLVSDHDLTISLLPYVFHPKVARMCIRHRKNMVTASYISQEMREMEEDARQAGIIILNEVGADPGIDHMSAMEIIHNVEKNGGKITSFKSYCGGLPAPESNTNPLGYKFSWAPKGVVLAARNSARYLWEGHIREIPTEKLFEDVHLIEVEGVGKLEAYPNRNSTGYIDLYGLKDVDTMYRGTLRNPGWCSLWQKIKELDMLEIEEWTAEGMSRRSFMARLVGSDPEEDVREAAASKLGIPEDSPEIEKLSWLGFFKETPIRDGKISNLDVLVDVLLEKLKYEPGERDMLVLHHEFVADFGEKRERITSSLIDYGIPDGDTAMARTVSLPAAIASAMILEGRITETGVHIPILHDIYDPILRELEKQGISFKERRYAL